MDLIGPILTKICRLCLIDKPRTDFYKHPSTKDRLRSECTECWNKLSLKYHASNLEAVLHKQRVRHFKNNYNLSLEDLERMKLQQDYKCAICKRETELVVDHCHKLNSVRKLLCAQCNQGLGSFKDSPTVLREAANYLELHI